VWVRSMSGVGSKGGSQIGQTEPGFVQALCPDRDPNLGSNCLVQICSVLDWSLSQGLDSGFL
uniref:Uncharacterized protein n=1 Tax=Cannabis sativa TaxID=3483 RepID=A0A803QRD0_CANSA